MFGKIQLKPREFAIQLFPIFSWCKSYDLQNGIGDLIAGITVALTLIPQSIAYASLAGFEPQYGLYASLAGGFVYAFMGSIPQINIGPTALLSLLTYTYTNGTNTDVAILLCFVAGIVQIITGVLQLGFLVEFVSSPVVSGFTSAAAITIASSQIKGLLGLKFSSESFMETWSGVFHHIYDTRLADALLSLGCCVILMGLKVLKDLPIKEADDEKNMNKAAYLKGFLWFLGVSRNAVIVVLAAVIAYFVYEDTTNPLTLTGEITPGLPAPKLPPFHTMVGNTTFSAGDMLAHLGSGLAVVPLVGIIANVAIAKAFSNGKTLNATQEIIALGVCSVISSFFSAFPVNGSFTRSAVSDASGVRTPAAGFYTGIVVILTLVLLTPYFFFIPRPALASVIICAVLHMVDIDIIKRLWKVNKLDLIPLFGTFILCVTLGIEIGLVCGVAIDALLLLYYNSRPPLDIILVHDTSMPSHYVVRPVGNLHFASAERVRSKLTALRNPSNPVLINDIKSNDLHCSLENGVIMNENSISIGIQEVPKTIVIDCEELHRVDYTSLQCLKMLVKEWSQLDKGYIIWYRADEHVKLQLEVTLSDPIICDSESSLATILYGLSLESHQVPVTNDTSL